MSEKFTFTVTLDEHSVLELMELSCGNHACNFNPPKGMGTNAGCSCLKHPGDVTHNQMRAFNRLARQIVKQVREAPQSPETNETH